MTIGKLIGRILRYLLYALVVVLYFFCVYELPYKGLITLSDHSLAFSNHGFGNYAPDNSLIGAKTALEDGLDGVVLTVQLTADKQVVVFRDLSIDRLTTDTGRVASKTLVELQQLDLGTKFGMHFSDVRIRTLDDFLEQLGGQGTVLLEVRVYGVANAGIEEKVAEIIKKHDAYEQVYVNSFNPWVLYRIKKIDPQIRTVFSFMDTVWNAELRAEVTPGDEISLPWYLRQEFTRRLIRNVVKPDALSVSNAVDEGVIEALIGKGYPVILWNLDTDESIKWALRKQPYGIISNEPLLTKKLRDELVAKP